MTRGSTGVFDSPEWAHYSGVRGGETDRGKCSKESRVRKQLPRFTFNVNFLLWMHLNWKRKLKRWELQCGSLFVCFWKCYEATRKEPMGLWAGICFEGHFCGVVGRGGEGGISAVPLELSWTLQVASGNLQLTILQWYITHCTISSLAK